MIMLLIADHCLNKITSYTERLLFKQMLTSTKYQMGLRATLVYALLLQIGFQYSP